MTRVAQAGSTLRSEAVLGPDHPAIQGCTGRGVTVAVLDSGINALHPHVRRIAGHVTFADDGSAHGDPVDRLGHGTAVAAAIQEKAPDAELHVVKVFDDRLSTTIVALLRALDWATERGIRLVNLSLGTARRQHEDVLAEALIRARERGVILVSAREHAGQPWFPGCLTDAVGVLLDWSCRRDSAHLAARRDRTTIARASGYPRPIPGVPAERNLKGVSFAVANTTGLIARVLEGRPEIAGAGDITRIVCGD